MTDQLGETPGASDWSSLNDLPLEHPLKRIQGYAHNVLLQREELGRALESDQLAKRVLGVMRALREIGRGIEHEALTLSKASYQKETDMLMQQNKQNQRAELVQAVDLLYTALHDVTATEDVLIWACKRAQERIKNWMQLPRLTQDDTGAACEPNSKPFYRQSH